jgi:hypothetical protein
MQSRYLVPLLTIAAVAFACGPRPRSTQQAAAAATPTVSRKTLRAPTTPVTPALDISTADGVHFAFHVTNATAKSIELNFPSGQTHDFVVLDSMGRQVWRWSDGRMFTQALQNKPVDSRETVTFEDRWDAPAAHGRLTAVATLRSSNYPVESRIDFTLP